MIVLRGFHASYGIFNLHLYCEATSCPGRALQFDPSTMFGMPVRLA
jgi:hypothetical protein